MRTLLRGVGGGQGDTGVEEGVGREEGLLAAPKSPPLTIFRIAHWCSKCPDWVFTCVTRDFLMSNVNGDIKCPQSGLNTYYTMCTV